MKIIVIDDVEVVRIMLLQQLESLSHEATGFRTGREGVAYYRDQGGDVDLVLLDMKMEDMEGWQCFHALREHDEKVRVLFSTGQEPNITGNDLPEGGIGVLRKPYTFADLSVALANAKLSHVVPDGGSGRGREARRRP